MMLIGTPAPDFRLPDHHGHTWQLSALRGKVVLVVFFPFAFTGVCRGELSAIRDDLVPALPASSEVLAVSCDTMYSLRVFADSEGFDFPLLSDFWPHGAVASSYGVFDEERGCALRGSFLIDTKGIVQWSVVNGIPDARDVEQYRHALDGLTGTRR